MSLGLKFDQFPTRYHAALRDVIDKDSDELLERILSGAPKGATGKLAASIKKRLIDTPEKITGAVYVSEDFAKAGALEYGGRGREFEVTAHQMMLDHIFANAALNPSKVFVEAHDRTLNIAARRFIRTPADAMRAEIVAEMEAAVGNVSAQF